MDNEDAGVTRQLVVDPNLSTWAREPGSARRTSHIDIVPAGTSMMMGGFGLHGGSRDVTTDSSGRTEVVAEATIDADVGPGRILESLQTDPSVPGLAELVGLSVAGGFRAKAALAAPAHSADKTPLHTLVDDLPVASLIAGYADLYNRDAGIGSGGGERRGGLQADICAGWQKTGTMITSIERDGSIPIPVGPPAPPLELEGDEHSWHELGRLPAGAMRRRRLVDVTGGEVLTVRAMFRDTHVDKEGVETVLHEYDLHVEVDPNTLLITASQAVPRVLPWVECPEAVASAGRLVGHAIGTIRQLVGREFRGVTTCTHLNDLLRSIDDVEPLALLV